MSPVTRSAHQTSSESSGVISDVAAMCSGGWWGSFSLTVPMIACARALFVTRTCFTV